MELEVNLDVFVYFFSLPWISGLDLSLLHGLSSQVEYLCCITETEAFLKKKKAAKLSCMMPRTYDK